MVVDNAADQDQIESLKRWWKANGRSLIVGVVLGLVIVTGSKMWFSYAQSKAERASISYDQLLTDLTANQIDAVLDRGKHLSDEFGDTPYGPLAGLPAKNDVSI